MKLQIDCHGLLPCGQTWMMRPLPPIKRDNETDSPNAVLVIPIIFAVIFLTVFVPLFIIIYRVWRAERADKLQKQGSTVKQNQDGRFDKAELPGESLVTLHEMDGAHTAQEMPETKEGLSHEMLGAAIQPQELPAPLHEMPAEHHEQPARKKDTTVN
ncbi:hypothetical protein GGR51DRAFT_559134 [Nemania sp. FL0031]|nr:hypothetical protein GGR51DRAFT_559134 [Nemania sp. FL0031]